MPSTRGFTPTGLAQQSQPARQIGLVKLPAEGFGLRRSETVGEGSVAVMVAYGCYQVRLATTANLTCAAD